MRAGRGRSVLYMDRRRAGDMAVRGVLCPSVWRDTDRFVPEGKRSVPCVESPVERDLCCCCLCEHFYSGIPTEKSDFDHLSGYRTGGRDRDTASGRQNGHGDGGSSSKKKVASYQILPYLKNQGISVVDAMLISHTDLDHISGVQELLTLKEKHLTTLRIKICSSRTGRHRRRSIMNWRSRRRGAGFLC